MIVVERPKLRMSSVCEPILRSLPDWFGIEEAIRNYLDEINDLPTFLARVNGRTVGFLSLKIHSNFSAEIYVTAVVQEKHRQGIGRALIERAERYLREMGIEFLQVKTVSPSHPGPE